jgi:hypothetical protein
MKKILYVDDEQINGFVFEKLLKGKFETTYLADGEACLNLADLHSYDVILMDINLGRDKPTGVEILQRLRSDFPAMRTPVIAVTAYSQIEGERLFLKEGFNGLISKPVDWSRLEEKITPYL